MIYLFLRIRVLRIHFIFDLFESIRAHTAYFAVCQRHRTGPNILGLVPVLGRSLN
jgi:hypothetical protein